MKSAKLLLLTLFAVLGYSGARADTVSPYTVDFNSAITTGNHDFLVAPKWKHIVGIYEDSWGDNGYMNYSYSQTDGVDGSGTLLAHRQYALNIYNEGEVCYDLLVTPVVAGTVTLQVKASISASSSYPAFVQLYAVSADGTTRGSLLKEFRSEIPGYSTGSGTSWVTLTYDVGTAQRIGIRAQYVYMDNFEASSAEFTTETSLAVQSVKNSEGYTGTGGTTTYFNQQADGSLLVNLKVDLANTGDVGFVSGVTDGYTLTLATATSSSGTKTYYEASTINVPVDLAAGAVAENVDVSFSIPYTSGWKYYFVRENITGTTSSSSRYAGVNAYESKFVFVDAKTSVNSSTSSLTGEQAFGMVSEAVTRQYKLCNTGNAPLTVKRITLPTGFTSDNAPTEEFTVEAGGSQDIDITLPVTTTGSFSGELTIVYLNATGAETTYTLPFTGTVLAEGTWYCDFNGSTTSSSAASYPQGTVVESSTLYAAATGSYNSYDHYLRSYNRREGNKFITPLLHFEAGEVLTFDVLKLQTGNYDVTVYANSERKDWGTPVLTVSNTDSQLSATNTRYKQSITCPATGDYYFAFDVYGMGIDNIVGGRKVDVEHDIYIKKVTWPHEAGASVKSGEALTRPTVEFFALTNEAASSYTLKYMYGENEAVAASEALTASSTSSKSRSFAFTPEVAQTTTFEATKVVFTFTDGTVYESEPFDLTVTNEPKFHFVNTIPTSKWYEPTDRSEPIVFGRTNEADVQHFFIYNWGSAPLTVNAIRLPDGFTASLSAPLTVAPFDAGDLSASAEALDITFTATEPGHYSGNLEIAYIDGTGMEATYTLPISGTKLDATKWYANFDDNAWPKGSTYETGMSLTYVDASNYAITSSSDDGVLFITPKLTAQAGETLTFDARLYNSSWSKGRVVVYAAATRDDLTDTEAGERTELFSIGGEDNPLTTSFQTFAVTLPKAGDYYLGFAISGRPYVDELYGLILADAGLDLELASYTIPANGMQNIPLTATVNVRNFGLDDVAEGEYFVAVEVGSVCSTIEEGDVALPMTPALAASGTPLKVMIQSPKAGTYPVTIMLTDTDGNILAATDPVEVTFAEEVATGELVVGAGTTISNTYSIIDFYNFEQARTSDILYTAAQLAKFELHSGDRIKAITFKGTANGAKDMGNSPLTAWVGLSKGSITYNSPDKASMQQVVVYAPGEMKFVAGENLITVTLPEAITYDGTSDLRIYFEGGGDGKWVGLAFAYDTNYANMKWSNSSMMKYNPLAYLALDMQPAVLKGTVTDASGEPVAGGTVTLVSADGDNVQYSGTTGADGSYTVSVIQSNRNYDVTVSAAGYDEAEAYDISFAEASEGQLTLNFTLTAVPDYVEVTIREGFAGTTLSSPYALDLRSVEGLTAYKAIGKVTTNAVYIITDEVSVVVPDSEGLLVKGAPGTYRIPVAKDEEADEAAFADNLLASAVGGYVPTDDDIAAQTVYRYVRVGDECGFQLVTDVSQTVSKGKAYLRLTDELAAAAATLGITFTDGEVTGISQVSTKTSEDGASGYYTIDGRRLNAKPTQKGVYIHNGKKYYHR